MTKEVATNVFRRPWLWSIVALLILAVAIFLLGLVQLLAPIIARAHLAETISLCSYHFLYGIYRVLPVVVAIYFGTLYHNVLSDFRFTHWKIFITIIGILLSGLGWSGFVNPYFLRQRAHIYSDIYERIDPGDPRFAYSFNASPDVMNFVELNESKSNCLAQINQIHDQMIDTLASNLTYGQIDSLLSDSRTEKWGLDQSDFYAADKITPDKPYELFVYYVNETHRKIIDQMHKYNLSDWLQKKMLTYPVILLIMAMIGRTMGRRLRQAQNWLPGLLATLIIFPLYIFGTAFIDQLITLNYFSYSLGIFILPVFLLLVLIALLIKRKIKPRFIVDHDFVDKHRHEMHRFDEFRHQDEYRL